MYELKAY